MCVWCVSLSLSDRSGQVRDVISRICPKCTGLPTATAACGSAVAAASAATAAEAADEEVITSALASLPPLTTQAPRTNEMDPAIVEEERSTLSEAFVAATAAISGSSSLKVLFGRVGANDPQLTSLELAGSAELRMWQPSAAVSGLRLLSRNTHVLSVNLANNSLNDRFAPVIAAVLSTNATVTSLSIEQNDFREQVPESLPAALVSSFVPCCKIVGAIEK